MHLIVEINIIIIEDLLIHLDINVCHVSWDCGIMHHVTSDETLKTTLGTITQAILRHIVDLLTI
jgi:hypothetical protein